ncbi:SAM-dependent methyltransferase [Streptomyces sp. NPDC004539]|uniref:class I SAM-dependent methyltransferase n=1 Tax=Streptomyces sp. NPDC004539 TaxID=3154280 RepID=UPI0033A15294
MTPTLVRRTHPRADTAPHPEPGARARDWSEIQERMLVPLYEAAYDRLDVGPGTRLLALGCGSGLALLMAAARGADVTGVERDRPDRLALARERLLPDAGPPRTGEHTRLADTLAGPAASGAERPYTLVTAFDDTGLLADAVRLAERGAPVVLAGWGPAERCATWNVLRAADPEHDLPHPARRDDLEDLARRAGLTPDGSGRVACPFGYADADSAVRGLLATGLLDAADPEQVAKELREALHPYVRRDGTVWMPNVFRYLIARTR